jgi:hypothetical protein
MREETRRRYSDPEFLASLDSITDEDIAAQIAADPDLAPELDDAWFDAAFRLRAARRAAADGAAGPPAALARDAAE